jgi:antirestriction protein ArdC
MAKNKRDIRQEITDTLIAKLEEGPEAWKRCWATVSGELPLRVTGDRYKGINLLRLMIAGRGNPNWMTFKQAKTFKGAGVRKGEKGTGIVFYKPITIEDKETGEEKRIPLMKTFTVFNAEQIDGLPDRFYPEKDVDPINKEPRLDEADAYIKATGAEIRHGGGRAFFSPSEDFIAMPEFETFFTAEDYYAVKFHELVHWTGHEKRLDRSLKNSFGDKDYAKEELVAEIGSAFLSGAMNISVGVRDDHAEYLASWLKVLKNDKTAIFKAAALAQKAVDHLDGYSETLEVKEAA